MSGRRWIVVACAALTGCNLISGAADLVSGDPGAPTPSELDGAVIDQDGSVSGDPGPSQDGAIDRALPDGTFPPRNDGGDGGRPDGSGRAFVSSIESTGNLGGAAGADQKCTDLAGQAGLGGTFVAWVSAGAKTPGSRLSFGGPWHLLTGELVANTKSVLTGASSTLQHAIDHDEKGAPVVDGVVWTGAGGFLGVGSDCNAFSSAAAGQVGAVGNASVTTPLWLISSTTPCNVAHRLYCIEN